MDWILRAFPNMTESYPPDPIPPGYRVPQDKIALAKRYKRELRAAGDDGTTRAMGIQRVYVYRVEKALRQQKQQQQQQQQQQSQ